MVDDARNLLREMRDAGLPLSELANSLGLDRLSTYDLLDGITEADAHCYRCLVVIHAALLPHGPRDLSLLYRWWATPVGPTGMSLRDLCASSVLDADTLEHAVKAAEVAMAVAVKSVPLSVGNGNNGFIEGLETAGPNLGMGNPCHGKVCP